ncbi:unnamed protein product [Anisakis simplex]|uniref:Uncharacterized protein n=1 Tax=Anisakis simplex TaxID=6269 RepID=A0A0M3KCN9_ANISI|nr:unnamed protein product [Anisakis simplex]
MVKRLYKLGLITCSLGFVDTSKTSPSRFEIWDETKSEAYAIQPLDENAKISLTSEAIPERCSHNRSQRPQSWASTISNDSTASTRSSSGETTTSIESALMDPNGNQAVLCSNSPISSIPISASSEGCSETRQMADNDNNITTTDLDCDSSNSRSTLTSTSTPNEDRHIPPDSSTTASLNTIVESSSQNELLAAI